MSLGVVIPYWGQTIFRALGVAVAVLIPAGTAVYLYLFKMVSFMQSRLGPMEAGPYGSLQLFAEVGKFLQKEDLHPDNADRFIFKAAVFVVFLTVFLIYLAVPFGPFAVFADYSTGIFFAIAVSSVSVLGILMAGWSSANKYSLMGGLRAAGQLIAYELPLSLAVIGVVIQAGTLNMQGIVAAQVNGEIFGWGGIGFPYILTQFLAFVIFLIAAQAELTQTPFDMPIAEFASAGAFAALAATLYLGGWALPGVSLDASWMNVVGPLVLFTKMLIIMGLIFFVRFTYPRFREDQLQRFAWKYLIPIALVNIMVTACFKVAF